MRAISRRLTTYWLVRTSVDIENVSSNRSQRALWIKHIPKFLDDSLDNRLMLLRAIPPLNNLVVNWKK
jgi:hypothetical protein